MFAAFQDFESKIRNTEQQLAEIQARREQAKLKALEEIAKLKSQATTSVDVEEKPKRLPTPPSKVSLQGHTDCVNTLLYLPYALRKDHKQPGRLVTGSSDGTIRVWNLQEWNCEISIKSGEVPGSNDEVFSLCSLELNGEQILVAGLPGTIKVYNTSTWKEIKVLEEVHEKDISKLISFIKNDKPIVVSSSMDNTMKIWDPLSDWKLICTISEHEDSILSMVVIRNGEMFASASDDCTIRIWDVKEVDATENTSMESLEVLNGHEDYVSDLAVCTLPSCEKLVSCSGDFSVKIWDTTTFKCEHTFEQGNIVSQLAVCKNMIFVSALTEDSDYRRCYMHIWVTTGKEWKRRERCPEIPPSKCLLVQNLSEANEKTTMAKMLIASGDGDAIENGTFPTYIWSGGGPPPPKPLVTETSTDKESTTPVKIEQPQESVRRKKCGPLSSRLAKTEKANAIGQMSSKLSAMENDIQSLYQKNKDAIKGLSQEEKLKKHNEMYDSINSKLNALKRAVGGNQINESHTTIGKKRKTELSPATLEANSTNNEQGEVRTGDNLVKELIRPMLFVPGISNEMKELLKQCMHMK